MIPATAKPVFNSEDAARFYEWLGHNSNEFTEIRVVNPEGTKAQSFFVKSKAEFIGVCEEWSGRFHVYAGVNPRKTTSGKTEDTARVTAFPFDVDPPKYKRNQSATDNEKKVAWDRLQEVKNYMDQRGFSNPYIDDSGNGYRLAYKLNIPISNHGEIDAKLKAFFAEIKHEFSYLDNISDLPRIIKVAGSMNLKGEDTPERPHRISKLIQVGDLKPNIKLQNYIQENKIGETAPTLSDTTKKVELDPNKIKQLRPCMQHFLMNGGRFIAKGDRNAETGARKSFYAEMIEANFSQAEILTASSGFDDFNPVKCQRELDKLYVTKRQEGALKPWKCETLQQHSICIGDECSFYVKRIGDYHEKEHGLIEKNKAHPRKEERLPQQSKSDNLLELVKAKEPLYFQDQYKTPYIYIEDQGIHKVFKIDSREFKRFLHFFYYQSQGENIKSENLKDVLLTLEAFSNYGKQIELHNRITAFGKDETLEIWIDLCDDKWQSIKVTKDGWEIVEKTPPTFRRYNHMQPFTIPKNPDGTYGTYDNNGVSLPPTLKGFKHVGGREGVSLPVMSSVPSVSSAKPLDIFFKFANISEKDRLLTKILLVFYFVPHVPHVGNCVHGSKGSAKSTFHKLLKQLIDPSAVQVLDMPSDKNELLQVLFHHYVVWFDNINYIPSWISDLFCRVITGVGAQKRQLYTDDDDIVYRLVRVLGFNGINIAAVKEDLLDRLVLLQLDAISPEKRRSERELYEEFAKVKPFLVAEILGVLSQAIALYPTINPPKLFRMADFTKWGCAIAEALGYSQKDFLDAYEQKINGQIKEAVLQDFFGGVFFDWVSEQNVGEDNLVWTGKASGLFTALKAYAKVVGISTRVKDFPKSPSILMRKLNLLMDSLNKLGVGVECLPDGYRTIWITNSNYKKTDAPNVSPRSSSSQIDEAFVSRCRDCGTRVDYDGAKSYVFQGRLVCQTCYDYLKMQTGETQEREES